MPKRPCYTVLGTDDAPKIQFYHEIVNPKNTEKSGEAFARLHTQEYYEISFFISGKRRIKVGDRVYDFKGGDIFFVSPYEAHGGHLVHGVLDRYRLHIWPSALHSFPISDGIKAMFSGETPAGNRITLNEKQQAAVYHFLSEIDSSIKLGDPATKNVSALSDIMKLLVFLYGIIYNKEEIASLKNKLLLDVLAFIESSYDSVGVSDVEKQFGLSHATLWRMFREEMAISPSAYILDVRLKKAKMMILQGLDIQTVSDECGFCDCSYFIKKFKQKYGQTPYKSKEKGETL